MTWILRDREFESMLDASDQKRYEYFIKRVADCQFLWSLKSNDGWVLASDDLRHELVPVWPHERYASMCVSDVWNDTHPEQISVDDWLEAWIPGMVADNRYIIVFPTPSDRGILVRPERLEEDLKMELEKYE